MISPSLQGLSTQEVRSRRAAGKGALIPPPTGRTYTQILREDAFTLINNILFALCVALLLLGQYSEALVSAGVVSFNVLISVVQEVRAKRSLDRIALLTRPKATVIRDGQEQALDPAELVQDDVLILRSGDQIVADGSIIDEGRVQVDEALLTGESEPITRQQGDWLSSGSFCLSGTACYRAERLGRASVAGQLTMKAHAFRRIRKSSFPPSGSGVLSPSREHFCMVPMFWVPRRSCSPFCALKRTWVLCRGRDQTGKTCPPLCLFPPYRAFADLGTAAHLTDRAHGLRTA
jgi:magnesium-transporting ATPase (P-type)